MREAAGPMQRLSGDQPYPGSVARSLALAPDLSEVARARRFLEETAREAGFSAEKTFNILVCSSEALANAIEHTGAQKEVVLQTLLRPDRFEVSIIGPGMFHLPSAAKDRSRRGLGLPLMATLADHLALYSRPEGGTMVTLTFFLAPAPAVDQEAPPLPPGQLELEARHDLLSAILNSGPMCIFILDPNLRYRWANRAYLHLVGLPLSPDDIAGRSLLELFPRTRAIGIWQDVSRTGESASAIEWQSVTLARGTTYWNWEAIALKHGNQEPPYDVVVVLTEVTEQVLARREAEEVREHLECAQQAAGAASWEWDLKTGRLLSSPALSKIIGREPEDGEQTAEAWAELIHPEDREAARDRINRALKDHAMLLSEYRIVRPDGETRWVLLQGRAAYDGEGRAIRMSGIVADITDRKRLEELEPK